MAIYYADSSVLVKHHIEEAGSRRTQDITDPAQGHVIHTARTTLVEVVSALNRLRRERRLSTPDYVRLIGDFRAACAGQYEIIELTPPVTDSANLLLEQFPIRAGDAIQLASALGVWQAAQQVGVPSLTFFSADQRLLAAAVAEGLQVENPLP